MNNLTAVYDSPVAGLNALESAGRSAVVLITEDGTISITPDDTAPSLYQIERMVGGVADRVPTSKFLAFFDKDSKTARKMENPVASGIFQVALFGPVVWMYRFAVVDAEMVPE